MNEEPLPIADQPEIPAGVSDVPPGKVRDRAVELARDDGRAALEVSRPDWDLANRELKSAAGADPRDAVLKTTPISELPDPAHGPRDHQPSGREPENRRRDRARSISGEQLDGATRIASDGEIGHVRDFYFRMKQHRSIALLIFILLFAVGAALAYVIRGGRADSKSQKRRIWMWLPFKARSVGSRKPRHGSLA